LTINWLSWIVCTMNLGARLTAWSLVAVTVLAGLLVLGQLWSVHQQTSDWALWPKEIPSRVQFAGRDYDCGPTPVIAHHDLSGMTRQGTTAGGAEILAEPPSGEARVFILVRTAKGTFGCGLLGGP
jgi:hypothetical protein